MSVCNAIINVSSFMMQIPNFNNFNSQAESTQADLKLVFDCVGFWVIVYFTIKDLRHSLQIRHLNCEQVLILPKTYRDS